MSVHPRKERKRANASAPTHDEFERFFHEHFRFVKSRSMMSCHNEDTAEQLALDTFARAARAYHRFDHRYPQAWLKRILSNVIIDYYNKQKREREIFVSTDFDLVEKTHQAEGESVKLSVGDYEALESAISPSADHQKEATSAQISSWSEKYLTPELKEAIESLSDAHRNIIIAREILGYHYSDIGELFEIKEGTVMSRLSRARKALQDRLEQINDRRGSEIKSQETDVSA